MLHLRQRPSRPQLNRDSVGGAICERGVAIPLRVTVLLNIGPGFGGFRIALRPGRLGLNNPLGFAAIETALTQNLDAISRGRPKSGEAVLELVPKPPIRPRAGERQGDLEFIGGSEEQGGLYLVVRGFLPFRLWPLGGWAAYDGRHFNSEGDATPFTAEELAKVW